MQRALDFLRRLHRHNDRDWFNAHRADYERSYAAFTALVEELIVRMAPWEPMARTLTARACLFRIYRDVRFSKDKSPYKTYFGAFLAPDGRKSLAAGYYLHLAPDNHSFAGGGVYQPEREALGAIRQEIDYEGQRLDDTLNDPAFSRYFSGLTGARLTRPPKGYPADHPRLALLRQKDYVVTHPLTDDRVGAAGLVDHVTAVWRAQKPLNDFLNQAMGLTPAD